MKQIRKNLPAFLLIILACSVLISLSSCSLFDSDVEKAERYYEQALSAKENNLIDESLIHLKNAIKYNPHHAQAHYQLALIHLDKKDIYEAVSELSAALSDDADLVDARKLIIVILYQSNAFEAAIPHLKKLYAHDDAPFEIGFMLAHALAQTDQYDDALTIITQVIQDSPDNLSARLLWGRILFAEDRRREAEEVFVESVDSYPDEIGPVLLLAQFYADTGDIENADITYHRVMDNFRDQAVGYVKASQYYITRGDISKAEDILRTALSRNIEDHNLYQTIAFIEHRRNNFDDALKYFQKAADISPDQKSLLLLADYYVFLKDYEKARQIYESVAEQWPDLLPVKAKIAEILIAENKDREAFENIESIIDENPRFAQGYLLRGVLQRKHGKTEEARSSFNKARDLAPESPEARYFYGLSLLDENEFNVSLSEVLASLERDPSSTKSRLALAYIYFKTRKFSESLNELNSILDVNKDNDRARIIRASVYIEQKRYDDAINDYRSILTANPQADAIKFRLAAAYRAAGQSDKALDTLEELRDTYPDAIEPLRHVVGIYLSDKRFDKALALCNHFLADHPDNLDASLLKATVLLSRGDQNDARTLLTKTARAHPDSERPLLFLGRLALMDEPYDAALEYFEKALKLNPNNPEVLIETARIQYRRGLFSQSAELYESILDIDDNFVPALNDLAYLYAEMDHNLDRALELARKAHSLSPDDPDVLDTLGWLSYKKGSLPQARDFLASALEKRPNNPMFHYHLGTAYFALHNYEEARIHLTTSRTLGIPPEDNKKAIAILEKLSVQENAVDDIIAAIRDALDKKDSDQALQLALDARKAHPRDVSLALLTGTIYLRMDALSLAKKEFRDAIELEPDNPLPEYHLGVTYHREELYNDAKRHLERALHLGIDGAERDHCRELLQSMKT